MHQEQKSPDTSLTKYFIALSLIYLPLQLKAKLLTLVGLDPSRLWGGEWQGELLQYYPARERIVNFSEWEQVQRIIDSSSKKGLTIVTPDLNIYPKTLKNVLDFPIILFCKGNLTLLNTTSLAVVGTRAVSPYGVAVVSRFVPMLVEAGFCIVSGMAMGVDALAHKWALKAQGRTVAVLGSSADEPRPAMNTFLYNEILKNDGLIVSEFAPGTPGAKQNFPQRNRIIAGLSCGTLVIEAGAKSGSLITAGIAVDYARDVFSVPGPVTSSLSEGVNSLIKNGAVVACAPEDILAHYSLLIKYQRAKNKKELKAEQKELLGMIPTQGASLNELLSESGNALTQLLKNIDELEQAGYINRDELGIYYLN